MSRHRSSLSARPEEAEPAEGQGAEPRDDRWSALEPCSRERVQPEGLAFGGRLGGDGLLEGVDSEVAHPDAGDSATGACAPATQASDLSPHELSVPLTPLWFTASSWCRGRGTA